MHDGIGVLSWGAMPAAPTRQALLQLVYVHASGPCYCLCSLLLFVSCGLQKGGKGCCANMPAPAQTLGGAQQTQWLPWLRQQLWWWSCCVACTKGFGVCKCSTVGAVVGAWQ